MKYHIGLGSNTGDREEHLFQAARLMEKNGVTIVKKSSIYETSPVGDTKQPWFLNQVLEVQSDSQPRAFLRLVSDIEKKMGRVRTGSKGPRCIDIDILLAEDAVVHTSDLQIPHPELANRKFVLVPLKEIAYDAVHPVLKATIGELWHRTTDRSIVKLYCPAYKIALNSSLKVP